MFSVVIGTVLQNSLKRVGFDEKLRSLDYATYDMGAASKI